MISFKYCKQILNCGGTNATFLSNAYCTYFYMLQPSVEFYIEHLEQKLNVICCFFSCQPDSCFLFEWAELGQKAVK